MFFYSESENQRLLTTREERSLSTSNNHHIQQQQSQHQMKQSNPMPRSATSNFNKQNQNNTNLMPASRSCHGLSMTESSRNSSTRKKPLYAFHTPNKKKTYLLLFFSLLTYMKNNLKHKHMKNTRTRTHT